MKRKLLPILITLMFVMMISALGEIHVGHLSIGKKVEEVRAATSGLFKYEIDMDGMLVITKYIGKEKTVIIPDTIEGKYVTSIGSWAFECSGLTSITIPSNVTSIGDSAFIGCSSLKNITIPTSVSSIGDYSFGYCSGLESVTIPSSVKSIGEEAFVSYRGIKIYCTSGSIAEKYAKENKLEYRLNDKPSKVTLISVERDESNDICVTYKELTEDGYEISLSTDSKFNKAHNFSLIDTTVNIMTESSDKGKTYYVKVRAFRMIGNEKLYGSWSKVMKVYVNAKTGIILNKAITAIYAGGDNVKLVLDGTNKTVTWKSSDSKTAKVTKYGNVYGLKKGTATITATVNGEKYECKVTVKNPYISPTTVELSKKATKTLSLKGVSDKSKIKWSSDKKSIATVDSAGKVTAKGKGTAVITATVGNNSYKRKVLVVEKMVPTSELSPEIIKRLQSYPYFLDDPYLNFDQFKAEEPGDAEETLKDFWEDGVIIFESNEKFITNANLMYVTYSRGYGLRGILQTTLKDGSIEEQDKEYVFDRGTWEDWNKLRYVDMLTYGEKRIVK